MYYLGVWWCHREERWRDDSDCWILGQDLQLMEGRSESNGRRKDWRADAWVTISEKAYELQLQGVGNTDFGGSLGRGKGCSSTSHMYCVILLRSYKYTTSG